MLFRSLYKGRKPTAMAKADEIKALAKGGMKPLEIAKEVGVGKSSVYRILKESGALAKVW